ncbi:MAG: 30S ribosomal protein S18 [Verrucomicrobiota bacterium]
MTIKKNARRRRRNARSSRRRIDVHVDAIEYKNTDFLRKFMTERGKILPRRVTGMTSKLHRKLTREIRKSRNVLLLK